MPSPYIHRPFPISFRRGLGAALVLAALGPVGSAQTSEARIFAPDRVVIELEASLPELPEYVDLSSAFSDDPAMQAALTRAHARSMYRVFRSGGVEPRDPGLFRALGMHRHYVIELEKNSDLEAAQLALRSSKSVASVRLDGLVRTTETPNDPLFVNQWDHQNVNDADVDTTFAWDFAKSNPGVVVAILDTGCDAAHPEIASALVPGYNFIANNTNTQDDHGHGTSCAGIAGARSNNGIAIAGVAPNCSLMPVKVLNAGGFGSYAGVAAGITFAANNGADVISMSLTGPCCDPGVDTAMQYAASLDVLSVSASGNANANGVGYPASSSFGMAVGASSPCDERKNPASCDGETSWGSNYGPQLTVVAPGVLIPTITLGGGTTLSFNGTSSATPHVAGIAALVRAIDPTLSYTAVRALIQATAEDQVGPPSEDTPGFDNFFGYGRVNAHRAALAAMGVNSFCYADGSGTPAPCGNGGGFDVGAANSTGVGALLNASGSNSLALDDLVLVGTQLPAGKPSVVLMAGGVNNGGNGTPFFDGLLCVESGGIGLFRHAMQISSPTGTIALGPGIANYSCTQFGGAACLLPGSHWNFQCWYRDPTGPCSTHANLSNGLGVTFRP